MQITGKIWFKTFRKAVIFYVFQDQHALKTVFFLNAVTKIFYPKKNTLIWILMPQIGFISLNYDVNNDYSSIYAGLTREQIKEYCHRLP